MMTRSSRMEAMIHSMTPWERDNPEKIDASRRKRIALGASRKVDELTAMLQEFQQTRKMMSQIDEHDEPRRRAARHEEHAAHAAGSRRDVAPAGPAP